MVRCNLDYIWLLAVLLKQVKDTDSLQYHVFLRDSPQNFTDAAKLSAKCFHRWSRIMALSSADHHIATIQSAGIPLVLACNLFPDFIVAFMSSCRSNNLVYLKTIINSFTIFKGPQTWLVLLTLETLCNDECVRTVLRVMSGKIDRVLIVSDKFIWSYDPYRLKAGMSLSEWTFRNTHCSLKKLLPRYLHGAPLRVGMFHNPPWGSEFTPVTSTTNSLHSVHKRRKFVSVHKNVDANKDFPLSDVNKEKTEMNFQLINDESKSIAIEQRYMSRDSVERNENNVKSIIYSLENEYTMYYKSTSNELRNFRATEHPNFVYYPSESKVIGMRIRDKRNSDKYTTCKDEENITSIKIRSITGVQSFQSKSSCEDATRAGRTKNSMSKKHFEGPDWQLVVEAARWLGGRVHPVPGDGGTFGGFINGCLIGTSGDVAYGGADIASNRKFPKIPHAPFLAFSEFITSETLSCVVPKADRVPLYLVVFRVFTGSMWAVVCAACVAQWATLSMSASDGNGRRWSWQGAGLRALTVLGTLLGQAPTIQRVNDRHRERVLILLWMVFYLVVGSVYQGALMSRLAAPTFFPDIDSIEALLKSPLRIATHPAVQALLLHDTRQALLKKIHYIYEREEMMRLSTETREWCLMTTGSLAHFMEDDPRYADADGQPRLHVMKEPLTHGYVLFEAAPGWLLLHRFNSLLSHLREAGVIQHWEDLVRLRERLSAARLLREAEGLSEGEGGGGRPQPLRLGHMQGAFALLGLGLSAATVAAVAERVRGGYDRRRRRSQGQKQIEEE